jgi:hypothetical protein
MKAPFMQFKEFDHDDIAVEFRADFWLSFIANALVSVGVFVLFVVAIAVLLRLPDGLPAWLVLTVWGV